MPTMKNGSLTNGVQRRVVSIMHDGCKAFITTYRDPNLYLVRLKWEQLKNGFENVLEVS